MSSRPSLADLHDHVDSPLASDKFAVRFASIPGTGFELLENRDLTVKAMSCTWPGMSVGTIPVDLFGHQYKFKGKREAFEPVTMRFVEDRKMGTYKKLRAWHEFVDNTMSGSSGANKNFGGLDIGLAGAPGYSTTVTITPFDETNDEVGSLVLANAWPKSINSFEFDGSNATIIGIDLTLEYDMHSFGLLGLGLGVDGATAGNALRRFFG